MAGPGAARRGLAAARSATDTIPCPLLPAAALAARGDAALTVGLPAAAAGRIRATGSESNVRVPSRDCSILLDAVQVVPGGRTSRDSLSRTLIQVTETQSSMPRASKSDDGRGRTLGGPRTVRRRASTAPAFREMLVF